MRSQVQRFPVDVHDIYEEARSSVGGPARARWPMMLLTTTAAVALGAAVGWLLTAEPSTAPRPDTPSPAAQAGAAAEAPGNPLLQAAEPAARLLAAVREAGALLRPSGKAQLAAGPSPAAAGWPIVLQRAGDGRFYADLSLDGHLVNIMVEPAVRLSRLTPAVLPPEALPLDRATTGIDWLADEVVLEHRRLPPTRFALTDEPAAEAVIGADLLARHFMVEEQRDRLRLLPRQSRR